RACRPSGRCGSAGLRGPPLPGLPPDLVLFELPAERVAVAAEHLRGPGQVATVAFQRLQDEPPFELAQCLVPQDAFVEHFFDQSVEGFAHSILSWSACDRLPSISPASAPPRRPAGLGPVAACSTRWIPGSRGRTACRSWVAARRDGTDRPAR